MEIQLKNYELLISLCKRNATKLSRCLVTGWRVKTGMTAPPNMKKINLRFQQMGLFFSCYSLIFVNELRVYILKSID